MKKISILFLIINNQAMYNISLHKKQNNSTTKINNSKIQNLENAKKEKERREKKLEEAIKLANQANKKTAEELVALFNEQSEAIKVVMNILKNNTTNESAQKKLDTDFTILLKSLEEIKTIEAQYLIDLIDSKKTVEKKPTATSENTTSTQQTTQTQYTNRKLFYDSTSSFPEE